MVLHGDDMDNASTTTHLTLGTSGVDLTPPAKCSGFNKWFCEWLQPWRNLVRADFWRKPFHRSHLRKRYIRGSGFCRNHSHFTRWIRMDFKDFWNNKRFLWNYLRRWHLRGSGEGGKIFTSSDGSTWTPRTSGQNSTLTNVTYANGKFVTVGNLGIILNSPNGTTWTPSTSGTTNAFSGITYGDSTFVAVGEGGIILTSQMEAHGIVGLLEQQIF